MFFAQGILRIWTINDKKHRCRRRRHGAILCLTLRNQSLDSDFRVRVVPLSGCARRTDEPSTAPDFGEDATTGSSNEIQLCYMQKKICYLFLKPLLLLLLNSKCTYTDMIMRVAIAPPMTVTTTMIAAAAEEPQNAI